MARARNFGWSPEQLARVNSRREARGQDPYIDMKMGDADYMNRYDDEIGKFSQRYKATPRSEIQVAPLSLSERQELRKKEFQERFTPKISMQEAAQKRTDDFKKRFAPAGSMRINANVRSQAGNLIKKKNNEDEYDSSISQSMNRMLS